jgi:hypothetical protein
MKLKELLFILAGVIIVIVGAVIFSQENEDIKQQTKTSVQDKKVEEEKKGGRDIDKKVSRVTGRKIRKLPNGIDYEIIEVEEEVIKVRKVGAEEGGTATFTKDYITENGLVYLQGDQELEIGAEALIQGAKLRLISKNGEIEKFQIWED